ncbi:hypothetical protein C1H46_035958 [Malus baccata]|uniref:Peroxidase n=1 Tax=Malus baccata TaxID=106549 RepID=A0A540KW66_MALBA|nr:hypothetical protein C1H46_035958 [Malus baccata]
MEGRESEGQLAENFYSSSCPNVESIVKQAVDIKRRQAPPTIAGTLRLFFHDCFVEGCDASIMIASPNRDAEDFADNLSIPGDGFDTVIKAKQAVEAQCPSVVSCADILAMAARDCVFFAGGPSFPVELGRRDGLISKASRVAGNLPEPFFDLLQLNTMFAKHNLSLTDVIALSGAHTLGVSRCNRFSDRLYNFSSSSPVDPSLNPDYAKRLMATCSKEADPGAISDLDPDTPFTFDNPTVLDFAKNPRNFDGAFVAAMRNLGRVGVKTGIQGEVRRDCTTFNS